MVECGKAEDTVATGGETKWGHGRGLDKGRAEVDRGQASCVCGVSGVCVVCVVCVLCVHVCVLYMCVAVMCVSGCDVCECV